MKKALQIIKNGVYYTIGALTEEEAQQIRTDINTLSADVFDNADASATRYGNRALRKDVEELKKIDHTLAKIVDVLPEISSLSGDDLNKIYVVKNPDSGATSGNTFIEYMVVNNKWEVVGEWKPDTDLSDYYTKEEDDELNDAYDTKFMTQEEYSALGAAVDPRTKYIIYKDFTVTAPEPDPSESVEP